MKTKEILDIMDGKRITNASIARIIDIDKERSVLSSKEEVACYSIDNVRNLKDIKNIISSIEKEYGDKIEIEISDYEIAVYDLIEYTENNIEVVSRITKEVRTLKNALRNIETAKLKLEALYT